MQFIFLEKNLDKVNWYNLAKNINAIHIIEKNLDKLDSFCKDALLRNPKAINVIERNFDRFKNDYYALSENPNGIHLLTKYNYEKMKNDMQEFNEELVAYVFNPKRLSRFGEKYGFQIWDIDDLY